MDVLCQRKISCKCLYFCKTFAGPVGFWSCLPERTSPCSKAEAAVGGYVPAHRLSRHTLPLYWWQPLGSRAALPVAVSILWPSLNLPHPLWQLQGPFGKQPGMYKKLTSAGGCACDPRRRQGSVGSVLCLCTPGDLCLLRWQRIEPRV